jgi:hypothetical protein
MKDMAPTNGGSAKGNIASEENRFLPGNRYLVNMKASGTPTRADNNTLPRDINTLFPRASKFALF